MINHINSVEIIARLNASIDQLEAAILQAMNTAEQHNNNKLSETLEVYLDVCNTQRELASKLEHQILDDNMEEVASIVNRINGLSALVRDDARGIANPNLKLTISDSELN